MFPLIAFWGSYSDKRSSHFPIILEAQLVPFGWCWNYGWLSIKNWSRWRRLRCHPLRVSCPSFFFFLFLCRELGMASRWFSSLWILLSIASLSFEYISICFELCSRFDKKVIFFSLFIYCHRRKSRALPIPFTLINKVFLFCFFIFIFIFVFFFFFFVFFWFLVFFFYLIF